MGVIQNALDIKRLIKQGTSENVEVTPVVTEGDLLASIKVGETVSDIYAPDSSKVSVTQTLATGTEIGSVTVDGTETKLYAPEGGGTGGSNVSVTQKVTEGTNIADITVDGTAYPLYSPDASEVSVTQTLTDGVELATVTVDGVATKIYGTAGSVVVTEEVNTFTPAAGSGITGNTSNIRTLTIGDKHITSGHIMLTGNITKQIPLGTISGITGVPAGTGCTAAVVFTNASVVTHFSPVTITNVEGQSYVNLNITDIVGLAGSEVIGKIAIDFSFCW